MRYFRLVEGRYEEQRIETGRIWIPELKIGLGLWSGSYRHRVRHNWLRWYDGQGEWLLTETEIERSEKERERSEKERERSERLKLVNYLRSIGIDPDNLPPT
jgi:hypothetical protein